MQYYCDTHEISGKSQGIAWFRYIGHSDLYNSYYGMLHVWFTPGEVGVRYVTQPLRNPDIL